MIRITSVRGNINTDNKLNQYFLSKSSDIELLELTRLELEKTRLRKKTDKGTDLGIILKKKLQDGDVLDSDQFIVVKQSEEMVACITLQELPTSPAELYGLLASIGHIIGNRHRPISIENEKIYFPIHDESEIQTFEELLEKHAKRIRLKMNQQVFKPQDGMNVHEH